MRQRFLPDIVIIGLLFLLALVFFAPVTLGGRTLVPADNLYQYEPWASSRAVEGVPEIPHNALLSDLVLQNYQWKAFIRENIAEREIPLWQPNMLSGTPFFANGQHSMLYPFSIIYYVLPLSAAFGWFTVSQLWLAGLFMYLYIRGLGLGRIAGLVAALTIEFSSFFIVATVHPMIQAGAVWLPLILLMIEFIVKEQPFIGTGGRPARLPWILLGGMALGMVHLAGHVEITYYTLLVAGIYTLARLISVWGTHKKWRVIFSSAILSLAMVALGFAIGAIQFIPNIEAANESFRTERQGDSLSTVRSYALPQRHVAKFLMPNIFGNPAHHDYFDVFEGKYIDQDWVRENPENPTNPTRVTNTDFGIKNYVEGGAYVGLLSLLLAGYGLYASFLAWRKKESNNQPPYRLIYLVIALISLSFAFGTPVYAILYYGLPGIEQLHTPFRWIWPLTFSIASLAAFGAQELSSSRGDNQAQDYWKTPATKQPLYQLAKQGGWLIIGLGTLVVAGLTASRLFYSQAEVFVDKIFAGLAGAENVFPNAKAFYSYEFRNVLLFGLFLIGAGIVFRVSRCPIYVGRGQKRFPVWQLLAVIVIFLDLFAATYDFNTAAKKEWLDFTPSSITWLQNKMTTEGQPFRIQSYVWEEDPLHANAGWRYGLQDVRGYDSLFSKDYASLMGYVATQGGLDFNRIDPINYDNPRALASPILDYLNVQYIMTDWLIQEPGKLGYKEVYVDGGVRIYENLNVLPRAYTVPSSIESPAICLTAASDVFALPSLKTEGFIPAFRGKCVPYTPAQIINYNDTEVTVQVGTDEPVWLILGDNYAQGWRAFLRPVDGSDDDEHPIDLHQVNGNLRGVKLDAGAWLVRFDYSPASFQFGGFISFIAGMLVIFIAMIWLWMTFVSEHAEQDTARRLVKNSLAPIFLNLFNRGIDFAFAFIMLRILGPSDAGIYYYAIVIFGWFDIFTNFGLNTLLTRDVSRDKESAGRYLFNTSLLRLGLALLGVPVLIIVLILRNASVSPPLDSTAIIAIGLLYAGLIPNSISTGLSALFYAFEKAEYPAAIATITTMVKVSIGLGTLLLGWGVLGLAGTSIITNLVTFVIMMRLAWPLVKDKWQPIADRGLQKLMMREAWPLMINHLLATVFFKSDIILMEAINGVRIVGIYSTSYKWLDAINIIPAFFTMALLPVMSRQAHQDRQGLRRNYILGIKMLVIIALPIAVSTTYIARTLIGVLGGPEFLPEGAIALQFMIWSIPLGWMNSLTQYVLIALDRQRKITRAFIVAVSFNIIANLIFLPAYSFKAAAITTIFSELVLLVGFYSLLREPLGTINWLKALWKPWVASILMLAVYLVLWSRMPFIALMFSAVVYVGTLLVLRPFDKDETSRLGRVLPGPLRRLASRNNPQIDTI